MKALVGAFNKEKDIVGAFSVIVKTGCGTDGSICGTSRYRAPSVAGFTGWVSALRKLDCLPEIDKPP